MDLGTDEAFDFSGNRSYSLEVWTALGVAPDGVYRHPFFRSDPSFDSDYGLFAHATGLGFERIIAGSRVLAAVTPPPDLESYHYVVGTYDGNSGALELYFDGIAVATAMVPLTGASYGAAARSKVDRHRTRARSMKSRSTTWR